MLGFSCRWHTVAAASWLPVDCNWLYGVRYPKSLAHGSSSTMLVADAFIAMPTMSALVCVCVQVWVACVALFGIGTMTGASMCQCLMRDGAGVAMLVSPHCSGRSMAEPHLPYRCQIFLENC